MNGAPDADVWTLMGNQAATRAGSGPDAIKALQELVDLSAASAYQRWIPLVSRFTYHLPSVVAPTPESV
jgi:hypothetical protein